MELTVPNVTNMVHQTSCHHLIWPVQFGNLEATTWNHLKPLQSSDTEWLCHDLVSTNSTCLTTARVLGWSSSKGYERWRTLLAHLSCPYSHGPESTLLAKNLLALHKAITELVHTAEIFRSKMALEDLERQMPIPFFFFFPHRIYEQLP